MKRRVLAVALVATLPVAIAAGQREQGRSAITVRVAEGTTTVVARRADTAGILRRAVLAGRYRLPRAAPGDVAGGRALEGPVLLERVDPPAGASIFALLPAGLGGAKLRIVLAGRWSFDAISPNGKRVYLIQHDVDGDPSHYAVRAYDVARRKLQKGRIADKRELAEEMSGTPIWRESGPGERWAYTLYERPRAAPFIHALDTTSGAAVCIDLPPEMPNSSEEPGMRLTIDTAGRELRVLYRDGREAVAVAVRQTFSSYDDFKVTRFDR
jgi:hypothetical protein